MIYVCNCLRAQLTTVAQITNIKKSYKPAKCFSASWYHYCDHSTTLCNCTFSCVSLMTWSNENIFRVTGPLCWVFTGKFSSQRPVTRSFGVFFDLRLKKQLGKQSRRRWFGTPLHTLWHHCNALHRDGAFWCLFWSWERYNMVGRSKVQRYWATSRTLQTWWLGKWGLCTSWGCRSEVFLSTYCDWK